MTGTRPGGEAQAPVRRLACALVIAQVGLHVVCGVHALDPRLAGPHLVSCVQDTALIVLIGAATLGLGRRVAARARALVQVLGAALLLALEVPLATYPRMLAEFLAFPTSLFEADLASASVFVRDYVGAAGLLPLGAAAFLAGCALALPRFPAPRLRPLVAVPLFVAGIATSLAPAPQPVVFSLQDWVGSRLGAGRVVPRLKRPDPTRATASVVPSPIEEVGSPRADHVLLLVLESVTAEEFEREFLGRPDGFHARVRDRAAYYARYHGTNLDSYTGLIALLASVRVPYRAYADPDAYDRVNGAPNLVRALRGRGHRTLFVSTYEHQPFVPVRADWDSVLDRRDLGSLDGFLSLGTSRMEAATEDRAAIPAILAFATAAPRTVILHELVFGHAPEWRARTGIAPLAYYDRYLRELLDGLEAKGLASRCLLVVVSDHGDRARAADPENYRIPLLMVGPGVAPGVDREFRSHLDAQAILAHHLGGAPLPEPARDVLTVGSTERWVYGLVTAGGDAVFVEEPRGRVLGSRGTGADPAEAHRRFQEDLDRFAAGLGLWRS